MRRVAFTAVFTFGCVGFLLGFLGAGSVVGPPGGDGSALRPVALIPTLLFAFTALGGFLARGFPDVGGRPLTALFSVCALAAGGGLTALFVSPAIDDGLATVGTAGLTVCVASATVAWLAFAGAGWVARWRASSARVDAGERRK